MVRDLTEKDAYYLVEKYSNVCQFVFVSRCLIKQESMLLTVRTVNTAARDSPKSCNLLSFPTIIINSR